MRDIVEGSGVGYLSCRIEVCRSTRAQSCYEHNHSELEARLRSRAEAEGLSVEAYVERIARQASSLMQIFPRPRAIANLHNSAPSRHGFPGQPGSPNIRAPSDSLSYHARVRFYIPPAKDRL